MEDITSGTIARATWPSSILQLPKALKGESGNLVSRSIDIGG